MRFSVKYLPTTLFSLKISSSTNSGAKTLFLPSPYSIKMAILNQAITVGGELDDLKKRSSSKFGYVRDAQISFRIEENSFFSVNNSFVKILKPAREGGGFIQTVAFREYLYLSNPLEIIFGIQTEEQKVYLQKYLHKINYFGKRGCFFQFIEYKNEPEEPNMIEFSSTNLIPGIIQEYDDFDSKATFDNINSFSESKTKREKILYQIPLQRISSSKSHSVYRKY